MLGSRWQLRRRAEPARGMGSALVLIALFSALVAINRFLCVNAYHNTAFWPANGVLVVAMLILPARRCSVVLVACLAIDIVIELYTGETIFDSCVYSSLSIVASHMVARLTRRFCGAATDLTRFRRLASFVGIAFLLAAIEAAMGTAAAGGDTLADVINEWLQWTLCDGIGFLLATPAILVPLKSRGRAFVSEARAWERCSLLGATILLTIAAFLFARSPLFLLIYPLLILTAFRAGPPWVLASILIAALISSAFTAHGFGPLALLSNGEILHGQGIMQPFLLSIFLTAMPANNALGEKSRASERLLRVKAIVEHTATHDRLTSLVNRDLFRRRLGAMLGRGAPCGVLFVDLDRFKQINDTMGHGAGDELLRAFGARVLEAAGPDATVARFGGDEFAILVPCDALVREPEALCRRITEVARLPFALAVGPAHVSASIGLAVASGWSVDASELMRKADMALYAAKAAGRDGYRMFSDELDRSARERAEIEADLRLALHDGGQLELHYQTKVDTKNTITGVEALLRWRHPVRGMIPPNQVIPVAEETGLIAPLSEWILREALSFAGRWPQLNVSINVSAAQLRHPCFVTETLKAFSLAQIPYGQLELEITEAALMGDINVVNGDLTTLRASGIRIALDDFGTGYSSMRHLHRCAVDRVKIDQSFVSGLDRGNEATAITRAVIYLGQAMGLQVTAEGVETEAQRRFLVEAGIDEMQGYLFSRPADEQSFTAMMNALRPPGSDAPQTEYFLIRGGLA
jgi:diguanylate cyclase (GGDEF)-like protein